MISDSMLDLLQRYLMEHTEDEPLDGDEIEQITEYLQIVNGDYTKADLIESKKIEDMKEQLIDTLDYEAITNILSNEDLKVWGKVMGWEK